MKATAFRPPDAFWRKRGHAPLRGVFAQYHWRDPGADAQTAKPLQFWIRSLP